jgi:hypothetical protein
MAVPEGVIHGSDYGSNYGSAGVNMTTVLKKRQQAFYLFSMGKRPSDPELKALGLKDKTLYSYFQQYKKCGHLVPVPGGLGSGQSTQPVSGAKEQPLRQFVIGTESIPLFRSDIDDAYDQWRDCRDLGAQGDFSSFLRVAAQYMRAIYQSGVRGSPSSE